MVTNRAFRTFLGHPGSRGVVSTKPAVSYGHSSNVFRAGISQHTGCGCQACARGDDVVHQQNAPCQTNPAFEPGPNESLGSGEPCLTGSGVANQCPLRAKTESAGQRPSDHFALVETTLSTVARRSRNPRDQVEGRELTMGRTLRQRQRQPTDAGANSAVLELGYETSTEVVVVEQDVALVDPGDLYDIDRN